MKKKNEKMLFSNVTTLMQCPECGDEDYERGKFDSEKEGVWFECTCKKCGATFDEVFRFSHIDGDKLIEGRLYDERVR